MNGMFDGGVRAWQMKYWGNTIATHFTARCNVAYFCVDIGLSS